MSAHFRLWRGSAGRLLPKGLDPKKLKETQADLPNDGHFEESLHETPLDTFQCEMTVNPESAFWERPSSRRPTQMLPGGHLRKPKYAKDAVGAALDTKFVCHGTPLEATKHKADWKRGHEPSP